MFEFMVWDRLLNSIRVHGKNISSIAMNIRMLNKLDNVQSAPVTEQTKMMKKHMSKDFFCVKSFDIMS